MSVPPTGAAGSEPTSSASAARRWTPVTLGADAPPPAGPYSPAVRAGPFLFISGQVPRDPLTGELAKGNVVDQSRQVMANLRGVLAAAGARPEDVVSVSVYLADEQDWADFNEVYRETFAAPYPSRAVVGARLRGILVELSAIAYLGDGAR